MPVQDCPLYIGVDVAKLTLAIQFPDQLWSTTNNLEGHTACVAKLSRLGAARIVDLPWRMALRPTRAGITAAKINRAG